MANTSLYSAEEWQRAIEHMHRVRRLHHRNQPPGVDHNKPLTKCFCLQIRLDRGERSNALYDELVEVE